MVEKRGHHRQVSQVMQMKLAAAQKAAAAGGSSMGTISE